VARQVAFPAEGCVALAVEGAQTCVVHPVRACIVGSACEDLAAPRVRASEHGPAGNFHLGKCTLRSLGESHNLTH
jgi:hypothetical protein